MSALILPSRFTRQPQGAAQIDWSNPITTGLVAVRDGRGNVSTKSGVTTPAFQNPPVLSVGSVGIGLDSSAASRAQAITTRAAGANATLFALCFGGTASESIAVEFGRRGLRANGGALSPYTRDFSSITGSAVPSTPYSIAVTYVGNATRGFINGRLDVSGTTLTDPDTNADLNFGAYRGNLDSYRWNGILFLTGVWDRALSDLEIAQISQNPWQIFRAPPKFYFAPAAGGGDSVINETLSFTETYGAIVSYLAGLVESTSSVDSQSAVITAAVAQAESVSTVDTPAASRLTSAAQAEAASFVESPSALLLSSAALSETTSTADTPSASKLTPAAQSETTSSTDTVASAMTAVSSQAETFTSVDTQSGILSTLGTIAETITAAASQDGSVSGALLGAITETVTTADTVAANIQTLAAIVEAIAALETLASNVATTSAISEIFTSVDSSSTGAVLSGAVNETVSVVDSLASIKLLLADTAEVLSTTDAQDANISGAIQAIVESVAVIDSAISVLFTSASVQETAALIDLQYGYVNATSALTRLVFLLPKETRQIILEKLDNG